MRQYVIDCTGDTPQVVSWQRSNSRTLDFGMQGGNYGPPNSLRLASGTLVLLGTTISGSPYGIGVQCYAPTGALLSQTVLAANTFFVAAVRHPTDPNAIVVIGDNELWEVTGLDTTSPTGVMRSLAGQPNPYPSGSTSPYYRGPGILDTGVDNHDLAGSGPLFGYNLVSGSRSVVADFDFNLHWPNGSYELAPGKIITALYGQTNSEYAQSSPNVDTYSRLLYVDYTDPSNVVVQYVDVKPGALHPERAFAADNFLDIDELNVGSTSLSVLPEQGVIVRGSTFLGNHHRPDGTVESGADTYNVGVWRMLVTPVGLNDPKPPLEDRVPFTQEYVGDPLPLGEEGFVSWTVTRGLPNYQQKTVWTPVAPDGTTMNVVGTSPVLSTNDDDGGYLQRLVSSAMSGDGMAMGAKIAPVSIADTDSRTLTGFDIKVRYQSLPDAGGYGYSQAMLVQASGEYTENQYGSSGLWVSNSLVDGPGYKDMTYRVTLSDRLRTLLATGNILLGIQTPAYGYNVDFRVSYVEIRPVYLGPPS